MRERNAGAPGRHRLEVYLRGSAVEDVVFDGEHVWPTWFKLEFKETGHISAKVQGMRLTTREGDEIVIVQRPAAERS
jgi:hypothetical protein